MNFAGKKALVTGAGRGIGRELVRALANAGAQVVAVSRTKEHLDSLIAEIPSIQTIQADLSNWEETKSAISAVRGVDLLVNNAGYAELASVGQVTEDACNRVFDINVKAVINVTQEVAMDMIANKRQGSIVNVSSQASMRGLKDHLVYCASKGAVDQLTRTFALELGPHQIRVNSVNPTVTMTEMAKVGWSDPQKASGMKSRIPLNRFAEVEDVVNAILFLLSERSNMINGVILPVDGGFTSC